MKYWLIHFDDNYADEFDVEGWDTLATDDNTTARAAVKLALEADSEDSGIHWCFGTNEYIEYSGVPCALAAYRFEEITQDQYNTLQDLFNGESGFLGPWRYARGVFE